MDWAANWIWNHGEESPRNEWRRFRKTFVVPEDCSSVRMAITADSRYVLYVNGHQAGRGPVRSWPSEQSYDVYDLTPWLLRGRLNSIAVLVMHYGVSNLYYMRGRGGLLAQIELENDRGRQYACVSDAGWKTKRYEAQDARSPRMAFMQAFAERIDGRLLDDDWILPDYDDSAWEDAAVLGSAGMEPWRQPAEREIPFLAERKVHPVRVEGLSKVKPIDWTTVIDIRSQMHPGCEDTSNFITFTGYMATIIRVAQPTRCVIGFLSARTIRLLSIDGKAYTDEDFTGTSPERYLNVELQGGDHFFLMDLSGRGLRLQIGFDCDQPIELVSPIDCSSEDSPFISIGPFDSEMLIDHQEPRGIAMEDETFLSARTIGSAQDLARFADWVRPVPKKLVSQEDVFALCVWTKSSSSMTVPEPLKRIGADNGSAVEIPLFPDGDTSFVLDFGKEWSGFLTFEVEAAEGTVIDFYGFEYMRNGWRQDTYDLDNTLRYICRSGRQRYSSPVRRGMRYLMVTVRQAAEAVKFHAIEWLQSNYPVAEVGGFQCSDAMMNEIWSISRHTVMLCMEDTYVDCPAYEQVFWVGDSRNVALEAWYLFGAEALSRRCLRLVPGSSVYTPLYTSQAPSGWNSVIPNWTFLWVISCAEYYDRTADLAFVHEIWPKVKLTLDRYVQEIDNRGLLAIRAWNFLDWAPIDQPNDGIVAHQNMLLVESLRAAQNMAAIVSDEAWLEFCKDAHRKLRLAINQYLWSDEKQAYIDCIRADGTASDVVSMQTQVMAYLCNVAYGERAERIESYLATPPEQFVQIGSPFMSFFYYEALAKSGLYERVIEDMRIHYGQMIELGATTCWEMFPGFQEGRTNPNFLTRSHCHAWSAAPAYFLGAVVLGVRGDSPGWSKVIVEPKPCGLKWARGSVPLPEHGRIEVSWTIRDSGGDSVSDTVAGKMDVRVAAPEHIEVEVRLPDGYEGDIELM